MKYFTKLIFVLTIFLIASCGDDNITNNNGSNNNVNTLFSSDSLSIWSDVNGVLSLNDSLVYVNADTSIKNINISCQVTSNMDSTSESSFAILVYNNDTSFSSQGYTINNSVNDLLNYNVSFNNRNILHCDFYINLSYNLSNQMRYIKLKDIKVTKLN